MKKAVHTTTHTLLGRRKAPASLSLLSKADPQFRLVGSGKYMLPWEQTRGPQNDVMRGELVFSNSMAVVRRVH
jgi:hypothetical protein